jgi:hypothetical protein
VWLGTYLIAQSDESQLRSAMVSVGNDIFRKIVVRGSRVSKTIPPQSRQVWRGRPRPCPRYVSHALVETRTHRSDWALSAPRLYDCKPKNIATTPTVSMNPWAKMQTQRLRPDST